MFGKMAGCGFRLRSSSYGGQVASDPPYQAQSGLRVAIPQWLTTVQKEAIRRQEGEWINTLPQSTDMATNARKPSLGLDDHLGRGNEFILHPGQ